MMRLWVDVFQDLDSNPTGDVVVVVVVVMISFDVAYHSSDTIFDLVDHDVDGSHLLTFHIVNVDVNFMS